MTNDERIANREWWDRLPQPEQDQLSALIGAELRRANIPMTNDGALAHDAIADRVIAEHRPAIERRLALAEVARWLPGAEAFVAAHGGTIRFDEGLNAVLVDGLTAVQERELADRHVPASVRVWPRTT